MKIKPLLLILFLSAFVSCGRQRQPAKAPSDTNPQYGDMYVAASIGDASYLNPVLARDSASGEINGLIYNGLVKYDRDLKLVGDLAQSWDISANGLVITFHLKKNVRWHDGAPFTAEDVKFTYERLIDPKVQTPYSSDYLLVKNFVVIESFTVRVAYGQPFAPALL